MLGHDGAQLNLRSHDAVDGRNGVVRTLLLEAGQSFAHLSQRVVPLNGAGGVELCARGQLKLFQLFPLRHDELAQRFASRPPLVGILSGGMVT